MPGPNTEHVTNTPQNQIGQKQPPHKETTAGDPKTIDHELKRQTENRKEHDKPEAHADRPRDRKLKPERKGVI